MSLIEMPKRLVRCPVCKREEETDKLGPKCPKCNVFMHRVTFDLMTKEKVINEDEK